MNQENALTSENRGPVFIHSLFRAGSTYLFSVFRRSTAGYWCYQEPLHELVLWSQDNKEKLLESHEKAVDSLRHPYLSQPYFFELYEVADSCLSKLKKEHIYDAYFPGEQEDVGQKFFDGLIAAAKGIPVIQECRTSMRIQVLKNRVGGIHLYLWRNPWDQWWSYKVDNYFDLKSQLFINGKNYPEVISRLQKEITFSGFRSDDLQEQFAWFARHRLSPEKNYMLFYTLWLLALQHGVINADIHVNIDRLSCDVDYRRKLAVELEEKGLVGLNFTDCQVPQACYGRDDKAFFQRIEEKIHGLFLCSGMSQGELNELLSLRHSSEPDIWTGSGVCVNESDQIRDAERARAMVRRVEEREVAAQVEASENIERVTVAAEAKVQQIEIKTQEAEARAQQAESNVAQAESRATQAEARAQQAESNAAQAEARTQQAEVYIAALHSSTSWRITKPLRAFKRILGGDFSIFSCIAAVGTIIIKHWLRPAVAGSIRFVFKRPILRGVLSPLLKSVPQLHKRLLRVAINTGVVQFGAVPPDSFLSVPQPAEEAQILQTMSPRARQIYLALKAAIDGNMDGGHS